MEMPNKSATNYEINDNGDEMWTNKNEDDDVLVEPNT